jgi:predicted amidophosphoribosyltransferase
MNRESFNGNNSASYTTGTVTYPYRIDVKYDEINYCPFCGAKLGTNYKYCSQCGKEIPRTTTTDFVVLHWNNSEGTATYPRDQIINPNITC